jgi:hypothetical protein
MICKETTPMLVKLFSYLLQTTQFILDLPATWFCRNGLLISAFCRELPFFQPFAASAQPIDANTTQNHAAARNG